MFPGGPGSHSPAPSLLIAPPDTTRRLIKYLTDLLLRLFNLFIMASSQGGFKETLPPLNYNRSDSIYIPTAMGANRVNPNCPPSPGSASCLHPGRRRRRVNKIKIINNNKGRHELVPFVTGRERGDDTAFKATP